MEKQMVEIVGGGSWITGARNAIKLNIEYAMGGHSEVLLIGSHVNIKTRFGNEYSGNIDCYEPAASESGQDSIVVMVDRGDGVFEETKIGLQHITFLEVEERGRME